MPGIKSIYVGRRDPRSLFRQQKSNLALDWNLGHE